MCAWRVDQIDYQSYKTKIWLDFLTRYKVSDNASELFLNNKMHCNVEHKGRNDNLRPFLVRHPSMEKQIIEQASIVEDDYNNNKKLYEGIIYLMFTIMHEQIIPLYIGKTETFGKSNKNLSENIKTLKSKKHKFARWGDGYQYHVGDLSAVVLNGHSDDKKTSKYTDWANAIFNTFPANNPKLKIPVKFWCKAWKSSDIGIWKEFGEANLTFLEYQLIGVASSLFPDDLLNKEDKNR